MDTWSAEGAKTGSTRLEKNVIDECEFKSRQFQIAEGMQNSHEWLNTVKVLRSYTYKANV